MDYGIFPTPRRVKMGSVGERTLWAPCGGCETEDAVIHGVLLGEDRQPMVLTLGEDRNGRPRYFLAYYCERCHGENLTRFQFADE